MVVALICVMFFAPYFLPTVLIRREEGIGFSRNVVDLGQAKPSGQWQCLLIDARPADDIDFLLGLATLKRFSQRRIAIASGEALVVHVLHAPRQYDVSSVGQRALG